MTSTNPPPATALGSSQAGNWRRASAAAAWAIAAAFGAYFCMYAFRKPFTAAKYEGLTLGRFDYKVVLVTAQVLGYTISKFVGIKVIAEMPPSKRAVGILVLIAIAQAALIGFGAVRPPYNAAFLFLNGLPLGMVFGLVLGFLEGRRMTEMLTAGLCASFILADGVVKSVGAELLELGVPTFWMPAAAGAVFTPPLVLSVWMLSRIEPPSARDVASRSERTPINRHERILWLRRYWPGLLCLVGSYLLITIMRSVRSDFAPEIWKSLGVDGEPAKFTVSETWVALGVMGSSALLVLLRNNRAAFFTGLAVSLGGMALLAVTLLAQAAGAVSPLTFMVAMGLGLYLPYVAVHTTIFERLIAVTRDRGNLGYLMYLADAWGYLGYVAVMLANSGLTFAHGGGPRDGDFLHFFTFVGWLIAGLGALCVLGAWWYFARRVPARSTP